MDRDISIRVKNLSRRFGSAWAIKNISFTVARGEIVGFLGPNGAGKSTTMRILSGILSAQSGSAWVGGISVASNPHEVKRRIGYMPENNPLPNDMRVVEYLRFRARLKELPSKKIRDAVENAMETCDLARTARRKIIGTLSKGFRQRVGIADALLGEPEVVIMDEPTIGLDPHQIHSIRELINSLRGRMTVILSSHILPEIERSCDRVVIINRGRVVASGTHKALCEEFMPGNRFCLHFAGKEARLLEALEDKGISGDVVQCDPVSDALQSMQLIVGQSEVTGSQILKALKGAPEISLHSLAPQTPNLEAIFLAATKRSWEETIEPQPATAIA
ncbi:MAG: Ribosome-associated ATPase [Opitutia bacterium UBA7350]|nr:MAG: Ribosome-associated ATPase [Opitutae bacterium UBA7350]